MHHTKLDNIGSKEKFTDEIKKFEQLTKKKSMINNYLYLHFSENMSGKGMMQKI